MKKIALIVCALVSAYAWGATDSAAPRAGGAAAPPAATAVPPAAAQAPAGAALEALDVQQIVDKNIAARGGLAAWRAVKTLAMTGQLDAGGTKNTELPFVLKLKRGHKSRLELTFQKQAAVQVFDGTQGWKVRPFLNRNEVEPFTATEQKSAAGTDELDGPLVDFASKGTAVALDGTEQVDGRACYRLKLTASNGSVRRLWIDARTFLEARIDGEQRRIDGVMKPVSIYYRDFQSDQGLVTPRVLETVVENVKPRDAHKMRFSRVAINEPMDDALFAKPTLGSVQVSAK